MMKALVAAAALSLLVVSGASASPVALGKQLSNASTSDLQQIGERKKYGKSYKHKNKKYGDWHKGKKYGRYGGPPPGWRSYSYRPWGWERRGCLLIGPVWYCP